MTRLWTGKGDDGSTGLLYGGRSSKASPRLEAVGAVDEAQAAIGVARAEAAAGSELDDILTAVAGDLWVLMAELATAPEHHAKLVEGQSQVSAAMLHAVEERIRDLGGRFDLPTEFVVPGQDRSSALLDLARTVVRRADSLQEVKALLEGGLSMAEAVIPRTRPERAEQLALSIADPRDD